VTLVLLVLAPLTVVCAKERLSSAAHRSNQTPPFPIALTVPEVRRPLGRPLFPLARSAPAVLAGGVVASMPTSQSQHLSFQAPPQLQLVVGQARSSQIKGGLEVRGVQSCRISRDVSL
jgi:hypothetical protein